MFTGAEILGLAQSAIGTQTVEIRRFTGRSTNAAGKTVATYAAPEALTCNFQPVPRALYAQYGLDFSKSFYTLIVADDVRAIQRGEDGDQVDYFGRRYNCESNTEWYASQGYAITLCVDVGPAA